MPLIDERDAEECPGISKTYPCGQRLVPVGVQGYDGVFRCLACHKLHCDLVLEESGHSAPNASEDKTADMKGAPGGARLVDAQGKPLAGREQDAQIDKVAQREKKRAAVLKKYGMGSDQ